MKCFIAILLTAMFFGNPTKNQHRKKITTVVCEISNVKYTDVIDNASYVAAQKNLEYKSYYFFSTCKINNKTVSTGIIGFVTIKNESLLRGLSFFNY